MEIIKARLTLARRVHEGEHPIYNIKAESTRHRRHKRGRPPGHPRIQWCTGVYSGAQGANPSCMGPLHNNGCGTVGERCAEPSLALVSNVIQNQSAREPPDRASQHMDVYVDDLATLPHPSILWVELSSRSTNSNRVPVEYSCRPRKNAITFPSVARTVLSHTCVAFLVTISYIPQCGRKGYN